MDQVFFTDLWSKLVSQHAGHKIAKNRGPITYLITCLLHVYGICTNKYTQKGCFHSLRSVREDMEYTYRTCTCPYNHLFSIFIRDMLMNLYQRYCYILKKEQQFILTGLKSILGRGGVLHVTHIIQNGGALPSKSQQCWLGQACSSRRIYKCIPIGPILLE